MTDIQNIENGTKVGVVSGNGRLRVTILWIVAAVLLVGFVIAAFAWLKHNSATAANEDKGSTSKTYSDSISAGQTAKDIATQAAKLQASPPASSASPTEKADYYSKLLSTLQDKSEIISTYEKAKSQSISMASVTLVVAAEAYAERNAPGDKQQALSLLTEARQYVKSHGEDVGKNGLTTGQIEWIDEQQMGMGL